MAKLRSYGFGVFLFNVEKGGSRVVSGGVGVTFPPALPWREGGCLRDEFGQCPWRVGFFGTDLRLCTFVHIIDL